MSNIEELQASLDEIHDDPDRHDQSKWFCGTAACFAGITVQRHGWRALYANSEGGEIVHKAGLGLHEIVAAHVRPIAQEILDLTEEEAERLFHHATTVDKLELMIKDLANGEDLEKLWVADPLPNMPDYIRVVPPAATRAYHRIEQP